TRVGLAGAGRFAAEHELHRVLKAAESHPAGELRLVAVTDNAEPEPAFPQRGQRLQGTFAQAKSGRLPRVEGFNGPPHVLIVERQAERGEAATVALPE